MIVRYTFFFLFLFVFVVVGLGNRKNVKVGREGALVS
jgi:hypothetical protein